MAKVLYEKDGRIGRITLNRPEVLNAIDESMPHELAEAVLKADTDRDIHLMVLSGAGKAFFELLTELQGKPVADLFIVDAMETFEPEGEVVPWVEQQFALN